MRVIVLGGAGFVGRNVAAAAVAHGMQVAVVHRKSPPDVEGARWIDCRAGLDVAIGEGTQTLGGIDAVIHAAGRINGTAHELDRDNVGVTRDLVAALDSQRLKPRIVFISSVSAVARLGAYGAAKRAAEDVIDAWTPNAAHLRASLLYGPHEHGNVGALVRAVRGWPLIPVPGGQKVILQPLYVEDLNSVALAAASPGAACGHYVVAGPRQERLWEMLRVIQRRLGRNQPLASVPLAPLQWLARLAAVIAPGAPIPAQQIAGLHDHPAWDSGEAMRTFGFAPVAFEVGIASYLSVGSRPSKVRS